MHIRARRPNGIAHSRLINQSCVGDVMLDEQGRPSRIRVLTASGKDIEFPPLD